MIRCPPGTGSAWLKEGKHDEECATAKSNAAVPCAAGAQAPAGLGAEEFGMTQRQLVQAVEQAETLIVKCMREQGFQYVAAKTFKLQEDLLAPVEERLQQELFSRKVQ